MDLNGIGRLMLIVGLFITLVGGIFILFSRIPILNKLGSLPGDIRIQTGSFSCFMPLTSMILISIVLTLIINIILRLLNRS